MSLRRHLALVLFGVVASMGASYRTTNFIAEAPTPQIAQQICQLAEQYRREKALQWLGQEMPNWSRPCPIHAKVTMSGAGGATRFSFEAGHIMDMDMNIEGSLDRLLQSVLPHEVTHTVFANHFRTPVPRWADEGGAVLSEDDPERNRHDMLCRQILNTPGRAIPLRRLFALKEYPNDVMALYAQGYCVVNFLVSAGGRPTFLNFVAHGMQYGWDSAAQSFYHYRTVEELEQAWLDQMHKTKRQPVQLAQTPQPSTEPEARIVVRQTAPPAQPVLVGTAPVYRGQAPGAGQEGERFGQGLPATPTGRPMYLPPSYGAQATPQPASPALPAVSHPQDGWQPAPPPSSLPPEVRLGTPQFGPGGQ
jgi:hypothetical protein